MGAIMDLPAPQKPSTNITSFEKILNFGSWLVKAIKDGLNFSYAKSYVVLRRARILMKKFREISKYFSLDIEGN